MQSVPQSPQQVRVRFSGQRFRKHRRRAQRAARPEYGKNRLCGDQQDQDRSRKPERILHELQAAERGVDRFREHAADGRNASRHQLRRFQQQPVRAARRRAADRREQQKQRTGRAEDPFCRTVQQSSDRSETSRSACVQRIENAADGCERHDARFKQIQHRSGQQFARGRQERRRVFHAA